MSVLIEFGVEWLVCWLVGEGVLEPTGARWKAEDGGGLASQSLSVFTTQKLDAMTPDRSVQPSEQQ